MNAPAKITAAAFVLDADELAELAAEDARAELIDQARDAADEAARWNRNYANGDWNLAEWMDYTGRSLSEFMPASPYAMPGVV